MGRLAALGCDPTPVMTSPMWLAPLWSGVAKLAEQHRLDWSKADGIETINALGEAM